MTRLRWVRVGLLYETGAAALVALWALPAPRSFFDDFPGIGMQWASAVGPYNEHYVRDVGALYLGFVVLFAWAALRPTASLVTAAAGSWAIVQVPHLVFHLSHRENLTDWEWATQAGSLAVVLAVSIALAAAGRGLSEPGGSAPPSG